MSNKAPSGTLTVVSNDGSRIFIKLDNVRGGGAYRDRTDDLMLAKQPLSQLS